MSACTFNFGPIDTTLLNGVSDALEDLALDIKIPIKLGSGNL